MSDVGEKLIAAVREVAAEAPDTVYQRVQVHPTFGPGCVYVHNGGPSCIVGHGAWKVGLIDDTIESRSENEFSVDHLLERLEIEVDEDELSWLGNVQVVQDNGLAWSQAIADADRLAESRAFEVEDVD